MRMKQARWEAIKTDDQPDGSRPAAAANERVNRMETVQQRLAACPRPPDRRQFARDYMDEDIEN